ncbi:MAG TPA: sigma-70 family RNA polymerase sigma factor [Verrucomicrobiae bacterium]
MEFQTTHWSVVLRAGETNAPDQAPALEKLCQAYWQPVYFFARRRGYSDADAKDHTQQFFTRLLARNDFAGLDPARGKFRTFLLAAFTHFLANEYDRATAQKRGGTTLALPLHELTDEQLAGFPGGGELTPAGSFDRAWAQAIQARAMAALKSELRDGGKKRHLELLKPFLTREGDAGSYARAGEQLEVAAKSVPVLVHRLRQRYRELVRAELAQTVATPTDLEEEMRHLLAVLNG